MRRLLPKSLIGQIALIMAGALLVAQSINFSLILTERQRVSRARSEGPVINRFVNFAQRLATLPVVNRGAMVPPPSRRARISLSGESAIPLQSVDALLVERLRESAAAHGMTFRDVRAATSDEVHWPPRHPGEIDRERSEEQRRRYRSLLLSIQLRDGAWVNARMTTPRPDPWLALQPALSTLLIYLIILAAMIWMAARLVRPLRRLAAAAERFEGRGEPPHVEPTGPADLRHAIIAFNAMGARVSAMLGEKDRMLGAIGHDLRTPLASLRIRAENVEPDEERLPMIATIEEMTAMLDNTLALARSGRATEEPRAVDLTALADTVVEEHRALGHDVELEAGVRVTGRVQPDLLRRAIRNLVENAVKYGGGARVLVRESDDEIAIEISDSGPGIEPGELEQVLEPFYRTDKSRSRETGGAGLGLTLARAAALAHGGSLALRNREQGGLAATILLPKAR